MFIMRFLIGNVFSVILIGIILLLKRLLGNKVSLKFHYHIWFTLLLSLVIVFLPTSLFQPMTFESTAQNTAEQATVTTDNTISAPDMANDWRYDFTEMTDTSDNTKLNVLLTVVWFMGVVGVSGFYFIGNRKLKTIKRFSEPPPKELITIFNECLGSTNLKCKVRLLQSEIIKSPISFGYKVAYIVLPKNISQETPQAEIEHILLHELTHIKHKDILVNLCLCAEQVIYWFNPIIWWAFSKMRCDREAYCDWSVLNTYNTDDERLNYGDTLLVFASKKTNTLIYTANSLFDNKKNMKYRIEQIVNFQKENKKSAIIRCCFIFALVVAVMIQAPIFSAVASDFGISYNPKYSLKTTTQDYSDLYGNLGGCAVIYDMRSGVYNVYNESAITKRIAPNSTCKIYSALNALEQGIITPTQNTIEWDNISREIPVWNGNQSLDSALKNSVNWYFQRLDKSIGVDKLEAFYREIGYGNGYIGNDTAYYWNGGNLKISPLEQVELLVKLYNNDYGFDSANIETIKNAIFLSESGGNKLYGKTGTGRRNENDVNGWFIGYVDTADNTYFFAVNLQGENNANGNTATEITYSIFDRMGIKINP